jgi:capsule polysaccharide export protein KpsE/RkpR
MLALEELNVVRIDRPRHRQGYTPSSALDDDFEDMVAKDAELYALTVKLEAELAEVDADLDKLEAVLADAERLRGTLLARKRRLAKRLERACPVDMARISPRGNA